MILLTLGLHYLHEDLHQVPNEYLNLVSVCSKWYGRNHQAYFKLHLGHYITK